ncbi:unnamed protein product [Didymodactylos carnosus]|uniref:Uncharacterized protein n=1 Tax=Didymodactylos carnosus TaxID=1234261 RepID=A0A815INU3_9BILA|nr:unnamed protein product [Didymodactylos carnosus]CAF1368797.1 unnamed protein product [Didymodactylos carnosus]CAF3666218.1 unnamed protein product [Didymodactylos carnosus]CAF4253406.1 unnamed protein product [Didymodactylos carnosus]
MSTLLRTVSQPPGIKDLASPLGHMGIILREKGEFEKARELHFQSLKIKQNYYGEQHLETSATLNNIALVYKDKQDYQRALQYHKESLRIKHKILQVEDHLDIANSLNNLGFVYRQSNQLDRAFEYCQKSLRIQQKLLPPEHSAIAMSYHTPQIRNKTFAFNNHPEVARNLFSMGFTYESLAEFSVVLEYFQKALDMNQKFLPVDHPDMTKLNDAIARVQQEINN